jgi:DNA-binding LacI/PurR family transcriptional regulator
VSAGRRITISDVAARAGVAISSVSAALNDRPGVSEATRLRILHVADELGFVPSVRARSLAGDRTFALGLVVHRDPDVLELDPFFGGFIGGIEAQIDARGYALVLQTSPSAEGALDRYRRIAADRRVDGVFLNELEIDDPRVALVRELGLPAVGINSDDDFPLPSVRQDSSAAMGALVDHLLQLGHTRFGFVLGPDQFIHSHQRERMWRDKLDRAGIEPIATAIGGFTYSGGVLAANELMAVRERPTAVLCANDLSAMGFISRAQQLGHRVPGDVSVTGFDGIRLGELMHPSLTTVRAAPRETGFQAARLLVESIEGGEPADAVVPAAIFVPGASSGPVPKLTR